MVKRYVAIWFPRLLANWQVIRRPELLPLPFVFAAPDHGRMMITAINQVAATVGVEKGMRVADARAICPELEILDDKPGRVEKLLKGIGQWCIRYSPIVAIDEFSQDGLMLDATGCTHLWDGEKGYLKEIVSRLKSKGYMVRVAMSDTPGSAWAVSRYGKDSPLIAEGGIVDALKELPPVALRLEQVTLDKLKKLGFYQINSFLNMPRSVLRRRFGERFLLRLAQTLGTEQEVLIPLQQPVPFRERLSSLEPIRTRSGITSALQCLLDILCKRLEKEGQGLRSGSLTCHRIDNKVVQVSIGTSSATHSVSHLFQLFELKIDQIRPGLGIELFELEALKVGPVDVTQEALWNAGPGLSSRSVLQFIDRVAGKVGSGALHRYVPATRYWPERMLTQARSMTEIRNVSWSIDKPRPTELLAQPERVQVMAIIPDHPPRFFIYKGETHQVIKADGPERIEREWWMDKGEHRDYYRLEDTKGRRYWLYRSGHHDGNSGWQWYLHGFFA